LISIFSKTAEFHAWLVEERKTNPETISKDLQRKEFARFVEDYNTATLPHEKYYNMDAYERRMNALRSGEYLPPTDDLYDFEADLKAIKNAHKRKVEEPETHLSREQLMELRKVQQERAEVCSFAFFGVLLWLIATIILDIEDEAARHGHQAKSWRQNGWFSFRRVDCLGHSPRLASVPCPCMFVTSTVYIRCEYYSLDELMKGVVIIFCGDVKDLCFRPASRS
jgi:hypothetical protein